MGNKNYTNWQLASLVFVRVSIGWHFLYEGLVKVFDPNWSASPFLKAVQGPFAGFFKSMASGPGVIGAINFANQWGLVIIGLSLMIGLLSRWACIGGIALLMLYYLCNPPFIGLDYSSGGAEGNYLIINKNLIELFTLFALFLFPTEKLIGIERILIKRSNDQ